MSWQCVIAAAIVSCAATAAAGEKSALTPSLATSAGQIDKLIAQLDSDQFGQREAAGVELQAIALPAVAALRKAAVGNSLEVSYRAVDILRRLFASSDAAVKAAAREALEGIARSGHGAAAPRAAAVLKPKPKLEDNPWGPFGLGRGRPMRLAPNLQGFNLVVGPNVLGGGIATRRVTTSTVNGVKETEAEEVGRKIKIRQDAQGGIQIEITTSKNGQPVTEKYAAKNAAELKNKHPQAHDLYQQYAVGQGAAGMAINGMGPGWAPGNMPNIFPGNLPIFVPGNMPKMPIPPAAGAAPAPIVRSSADTAARMVKVLGAHLARLTEKGALESASKESREELKKQVAQLQRQLAELDQRLAGPREPPVGSAAGKLSRSQ
jgi:hypothetical protein